MSTTSLLLNVLAVEPLHILNIGCGVSQPHQRCRHGSALLLSRGSGPPSEMREAKLLPLLLVMILESI